MPNQESTFLRSSPLLGTTPRTVSARGPTDGELNGLKVAILVAHGADAPTLLEVHQTLAARGAAPRFIGPQPGQMKTLGVGVIHAEASLESMPSVLFDAVVVPNAGAAVQLAGMAVALDFVREQYRHRKPILVIDEGKRLLEELQISPELDSGDRDPGLVITTAEQLNLTPFVRALIARRPFPREAELPQA